MEITGGEEKGVLLPMNTDEDYLKVIWDKRLGIRAKKCLKVLVQNAEKGNSVNL